MNKACTLTIIASLTTFLAITTTEAQTVSVMYGFKGSPDGAYPAGDMLYRDGILYGVTSHGGSASGDGAVYQFDISTGLETVLYGFTGSPPDGFHPISGLAKHGDTLYGTTEYGGANGNGMVYAVSIATGKETVLYSFPAGVNGSTPEASVIYVNGALYGTTAYGGAFGYGVVFRLDPITGTERIVHAFSGADGAYPMARLEYHDRKLFGTTYGGGTTSSGVVSGYGTAFEIDLQSGEEKVLHNFASTPDGNGPRAGVIYRNGMLFGTTASGGQSNNGTVFRIDLATNSETILHSFEGATDGAMPLAALTYSGDNLYGTTAGTDPSFCAVPSASMSTIFKMNPDSGAETILYSRLPGPYGACICDRVVVKNGNIYEAGGIISVDGFSTPGYGDIVELTP